jgi:threonine dehydrogenase-like Zn-dependent dehydrogenase
MPAMRRAVWSDEGLPVVEAEPPPLRPGWARLAVEACGICGSDLHFWHGVNRPLGSAPGHEFVGTLVEGTGAMPDVRYVGCPVVACGVCEYCVAGAPQLCGAAGPGIGLGRDGGLADFVDVPTGNLFPVADGVDARTASLGEPLAVAVRGISIAAPQPGSRVLVLGAGTVGLLSALVVRDRASEVAITARHPHQREAATKLGVAVLGEDEALAWCKDRRPDVVIETVGGSADTLEVAVRGARRGGRVVVLGSFEKVTLDYGRLLMKEVQILPSFAYGTNRRGSEFGAAVELLPRFADELRLVQTHEFPLDQVAEAFRCAADKRSGALKVTVVP